MALHTLNELHNYTLNLILALIKNGWKINKDIYSENKNIFLAHLVSEYSNVTIKTVQDDHKRIFTRYLNPGVKSARLYNREDLKVTYYHSYNDMYADSKEEADDARNKFYANALGVDDTSNPIQAFADMLGNHISKCLHGDK